MDKIDMLLDELNRISQYAWTMRHSYGDIIYTIKMPVSQNVYTWSIAMPYQRITEAPTMLTAEHILSKAALEFGNFYMCKPTVRDRDPSAQRAPVCAGQ